MDTKALYITAIVIAAASGGYYYYSGKSKKLDGSAAQSMTYSAKDIQLLQTDERGNLYVKATVDVLEQDRKKQTSSLQNLNASMYQNNKVNATFYAQQADGYNDNEKIILSGNVLATKMGDFGQMKFHTDQLTGYPKQRTLETSHQVRVETPSGEFVSQGLQADLNDGQYEFKKIRGKYAPN